MSRPLTIGERQKLRTAEQRQASRAKGTETRRANILASEKHYAYAEGYRDGWNAAVAPPPKPTPSIWHRLKWWLT